VNRLLTSLALLTYVLCSASVLVAGRQNPAPAASRTVWDGVFTEAQAARGRGQFAEHCAECHGAALEGGQAKALSGVRFWTDFQETPVDYLLRQISTNMPFSEDGSLAGSLPAAGYADIVAHVLKTNGFPAGQQELTRESVAGVQIVRKDGPGELPDGAMAQVVGCLARGDGGAWRLVNAAAPIRVLSGQTPDPKRPLGDRDYALMFVITRLDKFIGQRMVATGKLIGAGGRGGINVTTVAAVAEKCE
jgi:mono/diheme cytochrome c family protein